MFDRFLDKPEEFIALYLTLEHLKYCLSMSKADKKELLPLGDFILF